MPTLLRILIVEDSDDDTVLLVRELELGGYEPLFERVDTEARMNTALDEEKWDLIVSDYSMPQFSGAAALDLCRRRQLDIPFIVVSGRIGEEIAVEMMKAGAHDYVMKDHLARLVPAVERELRAAQERQASRRVEAARAHLASIVETCEDAIISETLDGTVLSWNAGAEKMYGYCAEEMIGRSISILIPPARRGELSELRDAIERGERIERVETVRRRKDGKVIDISTTVSPIKDTEGFVRGASIVERDITGRKLQELDRLRLIQELTDALARVKTLNGLLPICASCKKIRNDNGYWEQVEIYIRQRSNAEFTHGICPECVHRLYPEYEIKRPAPPAHSTTT
jgi:PAS domain S-box-containing protein